ncbi:MAG: pentapeptide repeat-containing protein [Symploca sp. SIO2D2]|nr:pentapeptide repeat-containing protein [Symploca sp. SIO2D2]
MDAGELLRLYAQGERSFVGANFCNLHLSGANLSGANLSGANLSRADLCDANLSNANLRGADFSRAYLCRAYLSKADLSRADLRGTDLRGTDLRGTDLRGTDLRGTDLRGSEINLTTKLDDKWFLVWKILNQPTIELTIVSLRDRADLSEANLSGADLSGTNFNGADLRGTDLRGTDLNGADLSGADLSGANLNGANLNGANLNGANLNGANLSRVRINHITKLDEKWFLVWKILHQPSRERNFKGYDFSNANLSNAYLSNAYLSYTNLSYTNLSYTYLGNADLSGANLSGANLSGANLNGANLNGANLSRVRINHITKLDEKWFLVWKILHQPSRKRKLKGADLSNSDLSNSDLSNSDLSNANLSNSDLSNANLSNSNLTAVQILSTKFDNVTLTGACIQDWNINSDTNLDGVICKYVYLKEGQQERRPHTGNFQPGEFTKLFQESLETVDLIFREGVDWKAFVYSFANVQIVNENTSLSIQSIENKGDGTVVIKVGVPPNTDKQKIHDEFMQGYEFAQKALKSQYQERLEDKDKHINQLFNFVNQLQEKLGEVPKLMSEAKKEYNFHAPVGSVGNQGHQTGVAGEVKGDQIGTQINYPAEKSKTLAEAAEEIQNLLKQLEETNPTATEAEKQGYVSALVPSNLKGKFVSALQAGWKEAIKELLDNPYLNVGIATLEGWESAGK